MMAFNFLVAPDFSPDCFAGWHMLNTALQRRAQMQLHLLTPASAQEQTDLLKQDTVDVIYANPFDATSMIREHGFIPFARPLNHFDEMVIATSASSTLNSVEDLKPQARIALTNNKDVKLIGLRLLEPADLKEEHLQWTLSENYQATARKLIKGEADVGFFLADSFAAFKSLTRSQLKVLVASSINDISHVILAHPRVKNEIPALQKAFTDMTSSTADQDMLNTLGIPSGFEIMSQEQAEFMIDLMDTLLD